MQTAFSPLLFLFRAGFITDIHLSKILLYLVKMLNTDWRLFMKGRLRLRLQMRIRRQRKWYGDGRNRK